MCAQYNPNFLVSLSVLIVQLLYLSSKQGDREEYVIYDGDSFIADVGGFLGLLLGHSVLSMFQVASKWHLSCPLCPKKIP